MMNSHPEWFKEALSISKEQRTIEVDDGTKVEAGKYIYLGQEEMLVDSVTGNKLTVKRAQDNTTVQNHVKGAQIFGINYTDAKEDNALIEFGDDFGFDGSIEDWG